MSYTFYNLTLDEYLTLMNQIRNNTLIPIETIGEEVNGDFKGKHFIFNYNNDEIKALFFKSRYSPIPNIFDELGKYVTSIISKTNKVNNLYNSFVTKINNELKKENINKNDYTLFIKGSLVFRNKLVSFLPHIKNIHLRKIFKNVICFNKEYCDNSVLRESDFDVNLVIFNNKNREKIKNLVINVLVDLKKEIDTNNTYQKWINQINKTIQKSILESLKQYSEKETDIQTFIDQTNKSNSSSKEKWSKITYNLLEKKLGKITKKKKQQIGGKIISKRRDKNKGTTQELMGNPKLRFVDYERSKELFKNIDQSRKSFYINNLEKQDFTFQSDLINLSHLDKRLPNYDLDTTQTFISINENIDMKLVKNDFKRKIHFDLYRLKLNLCFYMKYIGSNEFKKNIGGELIDISFPHPDNAYLGKNKDHYKNKLMKSHDYLNCDEFNIWGSLIDLIETIEIESISISKPHKFEKRVNRFILLRFLEYWLRIPFRINETLNQKSYYIYNSLIKRNGSNFNQFFRQSLRIDYEFDRIKKCLEKNQKIDIYRMYRKFLRLDPYQTLFKVSRSDLDKSLGITSEEINHLPTLIKNHYDLYSIFFDINLSSLQNK